MSILPAVHGGRSDAYQRRDFCLCETDQKTYRGRAFRLWRERRRDRMLSSKMNNRPLRAEDMDSWHSQERTRER